MYYEYEIKGKIKYHGKLYDREIVNNYVSYIGNQLNKIKNCNIVGILLPRNQFMICSMLAALENNVTFVNIDVSLPEERIRNIIQQSEVDCLIVQDNKYNQLFDKKFELIKLIGIEDIESRENNALGNLERGNSDLDCAYVIFTSGTTGEPKGVEITRLGVKNLIEGVQNIFCFGKHNIIGSFSACTFDMFIFETIVAMYLGFTVVLADDEEKDNPKEMIRLICKEKINILQITPSRLKLLSYIDSEWNCFESVEKLLVGGEQFPIELLDTLRKKTNLQIFNMYGPTETTVWSSCGDVSDMSEINIGKPIGNTQIYLINDDLVPISQKNVMGEICIAGDGLARGYKNKIELTKDKFCELENDCGIRVYRTGDQGYYNYSGDIVCRGRIDNQVKIRGFRVELSEIDMCIEKYLKVKSSVTCFDVNTQQLINFYIANEEIDINDCICKYLPKYMLPNRTIKVDSILLTTSGKTDRLAMLEKYYSEKQKAIKKPKQIMDEVTQKIFDVVRKVSKVDEDISFIHTFPYIGIDSLVFVELVVELENEFDIEFSTEMLRMDNYENIKDLVVKVKECLNIIEN